MEGSTSSLFWENIVNCFPLHKALWSVSFGKWPRQDLSNPLPRDRARWPWGARPSTKNRCLGRKQPFCWVRIPCPRGSSCHAIKATIEAGRRSAVIWWAGLESQSHMCKAEAPLMWACLCFRRRWPQLPLERDSTFCSVMAVPLQSSFWGKDSGMLVVESKPG